MANFMSNANATDVLTHVGERMALRPKTFTGSHDDWNALTSEQKAEYDGGIVNFTDDYIPTPDVERFDAEFSATHNVYGAKNMFKPPASKSSATVNGVMFTISEDKSYVTVTATGEARSRAEFAFYARNTGEDSLVLADGNYIGSGCPSGGSSSTYMLFFDTNKTDGGLDRMVTDVGEGGTFNIHYNESTVNPSNRMQIMIRIEPTAEIPNEGLVFRPMIRDARIKDDSFEPYAMTNRELTEEVSELNSNMSFISLLYSDYHSDKVVSTFDLSQWEAKGNILIVTCCGNQPNDVGLYIIPNNAFDLVPTSPVASSSFALSYSGQTHVLTVTPSDYYNMIYVYRLGPVST